MNYGGFYCPKCRTFHQCTCENCSKEALEHPAVAYTEDGEGIICQNGECGITFGFDAAMDTEFQILFEKSGVATLKEYLELQQKEEEPYPVDNRIVAMTIEIKEIIDPAPAPGTQIAIRIDDEHHLPLGTHVLINRVVGMVIGHLDQVVEITPLNVAQTYEYAEPGDKILILQNATPEGKH